MRRSASPVISIRVLSSSARTLRRVLVIALLNSTRMDAVVPATSSIPGEDLSEGGFVAHRMLRGRSRHGNRRRRRRLSTSPSVRSRTPTSAPT